MVAARLLLERGQWSVSAVARALGISRPHLSAHRKPSEPRGKSVAKGDDDLVSRIRRVVEKRGSYGYRRVTAVLNRQATMRVNHMSPIPKSRRNPKLIIAERDLVPVAVEGGAFNVFAVDVGVGPSGATPL
jgi:putative transposase